jgi:hypothetical protein
MKEQKEQLDKVVDKILAYKPERKKKRNNKTRTSDAQCPENIKVSQGSG